METTKKYLTDYIHAFKEMKKQPVYFQEIRGVYFTDVEGHVCMFDAKSDALMTGPVEIDWTSCGRPFVLEEKDERMDKLCWFYDNPESKHIGVLEHIIEGSQNCKYRERNGCLWKYCDKLTRDEIEDLS